jgi:general secretion pathway protein G
MTQRHAQAGFSLMEILIAIVIVGIIAAVTVPAYFGYVERNKLKAAKLELRTIKGYVESFYGDINSVPDSLEDLVHKPTREELAKDWVQPYTEKVPRDPWGNAYIYRPTPEGEHKYELYSYGPKGKTAPENEWLNVWKL